MTVGAQLKQTLANARGARSTLRLYAQQAQGEEERGVYSEALQEIESVVKDLEDRLGVVEFSEPQYKGN